MLKNAWDGEELCCFARLFLRSLAWAFPRGLYRLFEKVFWKDPIAFGKLFFDVVYMFCVSFTICMCEVVHCELGRKSLLMLFVSSRRYIIRSMSSVLMVVRLVVFVMSVCIVHGVSV